MIVDPSNRYQVVQATPREQLREYILPTGSYSSFGIDLNPLDLAYRADTPQEALRDLAFLSIDIALIPVGGGGGRIARSTWQFFKEVY